MSKAVKYDEVSPLILLLNRVKMIHQKAGRRLHNLKTCCNLLHLPQEIHLIDYKPLLVSFTEY